MDAQYIGGIATVTAAIIAGFFSVTLAIIKKGDMRPYIEELSKITVKTSSQIDWGNQKIEKIHEATKLHSLEHKDLEIELRGAVNDGNKSIHQRFDRLIQAGNNG